MQYKFGTTPIDIIYNTIQERSKALKSNIMVLVQVHPLDPEFSKEQLLWGTAVTDLIYLLDTLLYMAEAGQNLPDVPEARKWKNIGGWAKEVRIDILHQLGIIEE
jgi:hypothetical protein